MRGVGSEQALAPVTGHLKDTFAEGAWDKVPKTKGTFLKPQLYLASERDLSQKIYQNVIWMSFNEIVRTMEVDGKI